MDKKYDKERLADNIRRAIHNRLGVTAECHVESGKIKVTVTGKRGAETVSSVLTVSFAFQLRDFPLPIVGLDFRDCQEITPRACVWSSDDANDDVVAEQAEIIVGQWMHANGIQEGGAT